MMDRIVPLSRPLRLVASIAALSLAVASGGCGRRGPLEVPPGSLIAPPRGTVAVIDPAPQPSGAVQHGLARDTSGQDPLSREQIVAPVAPANVPRTPFILDPLL